VPKVSGASGYPLPLLVAWHCGLEADSAMHSLHMALSILTDLHSR